MQEHCSNLLLASLSPKYRSYLMSRLKPVSLSAMEVLYEPDEVPKMAHFMTSGIASILGMMPDGTCAEVGIFGNEGLVQCLHLLGSARIPTRCCVQIEGSALVMPFKELLKEFHENEELHESILQNAQSQAIILSQLAACNRMHEAVERLARWFLMVRDRINERSPFNLTQESLAAILGSRRTTVTAAAGALQRKGLIRYSRGKIHIVDSAGLEREACECYAKLRETVNNLVIQEAVG